MFVQVDCDYESIAKGLACNEVESYTQALSMMAIVLNVEW